MKDQPGNHPESKAARRFSIIDPIFVCMCAAIALAIGSSLVLRALSGGASSLRASDADDHPEMIFPASANSQPSAPTTRPAP